MWILDGLNCVFGIPQTRGLNVAGKMLLFYIRFHFISLVHALATGIRLTVQSYDLMRDSAHTDCL